MAAKALIIDDERGYCDLLKRVLEQDGFQVETFQESVRGMEHLKENEIDLLVTDLDMPDMTGFDIADFALNLSRSPSILLITAQKAMLEKSSSRLKKIHCLLKPFTLGDFRAKISYLTDDWLHRPQKIHPALTQTT